MSTSIERGVVVAVLSVIALLGTGTAARGQIAGAIDRSAYPSAYHDHYKSFSIVVKQESGEALSAQPDDLGRFRIDNVNLGSQPTLAWSREKELEYVIWPLEHPRGASPFNGFRFRKIGDVYLVRRNDIAQEITNGRFKRADSLVSQMETLFAFFNETRKKYQIDQLAYSLLVEVCDKADQYRDARGRSSLAEDIVTIERRWRRAAIANAAARQDVEDLAATANSWANFAREMYSRQQRWPDKSLAVAGKTIVLKPQYRQLLQEDMQLLQEKLKATFVSARVTKNGGIQERLLNDGQAVAMHRYGSIMSADVETISLSEFVNLLSALQVVVRR